MDKFKQFLAAHSITAHSLAVVGGIIVASFYEIPQFHDLIMSYYGYFPQWAKTLVTTGAIWYMWYKNNKKRWTPEQGDRRNNVVNPPAQGASNNG